MKIFSDDVRKLMLAGLGAVASAVEKTGEKLDEIIDTEGLSDEDIEDGWEGDEE